jgi:hypothetical protein
MVTMEHKKSKTTVLQGSPNKSEPQNFETSEGMGLRIIGFKIPLNGMTSAPNLMKIYQAVL